MHESSCDEYLRFVCFVTLIQILKNLGVILGTVMNPKMFSLAIQNLLNYLNGLIKFKNCSQLITFQRYITN